MPTRPRGVTSSVHRYSAAECDARPLTQVSGAGILGGRGARPLLVGRGWSLGSRHIPPAGRRAVSLREWKAQHDGTAETRSVAPFASHPSHGAETDEPRTLSCCDHIRAFQLTWRLRLLSSQIPKPTLLLHQSDLKG